MRKDELKAKYHDTLATMSNATGDDMGVCFDKLVYMALHRDEEGADVYFVPEGFDYDAFLEDYNKVGKGYAYLDKYGILHCTKSKDSAEYAAYKGKYIPTNLADGTGYPKENGDRIVIYAAEPSFYVGGNAAGGFKMEEEDFAEEYPQTYALYKELITVGLEGLEEY